jgi:hypothetical protein
LLIDQPSADPADGVSFSWGGDVTSASVGGQGTGLIIEFDTYDNGHWQLRHRRQVEWRGNHHGVAQGYPQQRIYSGQWRVDG